MKKPIIGIVGRIGTNAKGTELFYLFDRYRRAVIDFGGNPILILPPQNISYHKQQSFSEMEELTDGEKKMLEEQISLCDGILSPGGYKIFKYDRFILEYTAKHHIPTLAICVGMQAMAHNFQNHTLMAKDPCTIRHNQEQEKYCHEVIVEKESKLYQILKEERIKVNSLHSHFLENPGIYQISALSDDHQIEAIEQKEEDFYIGVQWHPEMMIAYDQSSKKLFHAFMNASKKYPQQKEKH